MITCPECGATFDEKRVKEKGLALQKSTPLAVVKPATQHKDSTKSPDRQGRVSREVLIDEQLDEFIHEYMKSRHFAAIKGGYSVVINMALTYFKAAINQKGETA